MPFRTDFSDPRAYNDATTEEYRASGGQVTGDFAGRQLLLLTTVGAKSGDERVTPLIYTKEGDSFLVTAADGGSDRHPGWYYNLVANPDVIVEVGAQRHRARARVAEGAEHDRLFEKRVAETPRFGEYQAKTARKIPIVLLTPVD